MGAGDLEKALLRQMLEYQAMLTPRCAAIASAVKPGGNHEKKAKNIQHVMSKLRETGVLSLMALPSLAEQDAEKELCRLTGFKKQSKTVRDVLNFTFDRVAWATSTNSKQVPDRHDKWHGEGPMPACLANHVSD